MNALTRPGRVGPRQLRRLLIALAHETCPDADRLVLVVDRGLGHKGESFIRVADPPPAKGERGPSAARLRAYLGSLVRTVFPDALTAYAVFCRGGESVFAVELPAAT